MSFLPKRESGVDNVLLVEDDEAEDNSGGILIANFKRAIHPELQKRLLNTYYTARTG